MRDGGRIFLLVGSRLRGASCRSSKCYRSGVPDAQKLAEKARILNAVQQELGLRRPLNNASIAGSRTYESGTEAFDRIRKACDSWPRLLHAFASLKEADFAQPQQQKFDAVLDALSARACADR